MGSSTQHVGIQLLSQAPHHDCDGPRGIKGNAHRSVERCSRTCAVRMPVVVDAYCACEASRECRHAIVRQVDVAHKVIKPIRLQAQDGGKWRWKQKHSPGGYHKMRLRFPASLALTTIAKVPAASTATP